MEILSIVLLVLLGWFFLYYIPKKNWELQQEDEFYNNFYDAFETYNELVTDVITAFCLPHNLPSGQHECLFCCLCFDKLTIEQCSKDKYGNLQDVCLACQEEERIQHERTIL
jgi:hypothetical protein